MYTSLPEKAPRQIDEMDRRRRAEKRLSEVAKRTDKRRIKAGIMPVEDLVPTVSEVTVGALKEMNFRYISQDCGELIAHVLNGRNVQGCGWSGWDKTIGLLIPAVELLRRNSNKPQDGTVVLFICSTAIMAAQTHEVAQKLLNSGSSICLSVGAWDSTNSIEEGVDLLITTHSRLLNLIENSKGFQYENLQGRQTVFFYSTWSEQVDDLRKNIFQTTAIDCACGTDMVINDKTKLLYCVIPTEKRSFHLLSFLEMNKQKKVIVFFSSNECAKFHAELFQEHGIDCFKVHGKRKRRDRASIFFEFCEAKKGILLCTQIAIEHLNIPVVDWIVSYDAPSEPEQYIRKVYQCARWEDARTNILFCLAPDGLEFVRHIQEAYVFAAEYELPTSSRPS